MTKFALFKGNWEGNQWPCVEITPYEYADFLPVLTHLCTALNVPLPPVTDILDGYAAELNVDGVKVTVMMDNWSFSVAAESERVRDKIYDALLTLTS